MKPQKKKRNSKTKTTAARKIAQLERAAKTGEANFRRLLEFAPDAIVSTDKKGRIVLVNSQTEKMFGYSRDELLGKLVEILLPERMRDSHFGHRADYVSDPRTRHMGAGLELHGRRKDGSEFPVDIALSPVETDGGLLVTAIIRDISERKQAEEALRQSERRYRILTDVSPVGIFHTDAKGDCLYVNERWSEITGLPVEEAYGEGWAKALHPDDRERVVEEWYQAAKEKRPFREEYRFKHADGVTTWVFGQAMSVRGDSGEVTGYVGTITDITERKRAEEALQARYEEIYALHEIGQTVLNSPDLKTTVEGILDKALSVCSFDIGLIRLLDPSGRMLKPVASRGYQDPHDIREISTDVRDATAGAIQLKVLTSKEANAVDNVTTSPGLQTFKNEGVQSAIVVPVRAEERVLGTIQLGSRTPRKFEPYEISLLETVGSNLGIAVQKAQLYEEMEKLASDLTKSNKVKDEFLSVMSHELRTPLNVVMGYTGMIKDRLLGEINPQQEEALGKVIGGANDQLAIVNNILHATVLETEKINIESHEVSLEDFFNQLRWGYEAPINKKLTLNWDYPSDLPAIKIDGGKLKQILQNLIDNAMKFTDKGSVTISARIKDAGKQVEFKVADTGVGIPKEALPFIFEKFRQVDSSETRLYGGVGLGLYIVKKLTELLRGKVEVESEPGEGSVFTVTIPCS